MNTYRRLKSLCDKVNRRAKNHLNDDDEVKQMFDYARNNPLKVRVAVGSEYRAVTTNFVYKIAKLYKQNIVDNALLKTYDGGQYIGIVLISEEVKKEPEYEDMIGGNYVVWITASEYNQI